MAEQATYRTIRQRLRERICLAPIDQRVILHETELAREYGLSRTPVRQALQELALEGMVGTRVGVGTVVSALPDEGRDAALRAYCEIARAAARCSEGAPVAAEVEAKLHAYARRAGAIAEVTVEDYIHVHGEIADALELLVADDILARALHAAHWRVIRWRAQDFGTDPATAWRSLSRNLAEVAELAARYDAATVLEAAAGITDRLIHHPRVIRGGGESPLAPCPASLPS